MNYRYLDKNEKYKIKEPTQWGEKLDKVVNTIDTSEKEIALIFLITMLLCVLILHILH